MLTPRCHALSDEKSCILDDINVTHTDATRPKDAASVQCEKALGLQRAVSEQFELIFDSIVKQQDTGRGGCMPVPFFVSLFLTDLENFSAVDDARAHLDVHDDHPHERPCGHGRDEDAHDVHAVHGHQVGVRQPLPVS